MSAIVFIHDDKPDRNGNQVDIEGLSFPDSVPLRLNFSGEPIGSANLRREGRQIVADLRVTGRPPKGVFYPAIGFKPTALLDSTDTPYSVISKADLLEVSLCESNADERIPAVIFTPKNRVLSIHIMDSEARFDKDVAWRISADIVVPGLGEVSIKDCLSQETIDKVCTEVLFALNQKMGVKS